MSKIYKVTIGDVDDEGYQDVFYLPDRTAVKALEEWVTTNFGEGVWYDYIDVDHLKVITSLTPIKRVLKRDLGDISEEEAGVEYRRSMRRDR